MKKRTRAQEAIYTLIFMLVITVVCVSGVALAYQLTKKQIELNQKLLERKAILSAAGFDLEKSTPEEIDKQYKNLVEEEKDTNNKILFYSIKGKGLVIPQSGMGLWGTIYAVIGFEKNAKVMTGIFFTDQVETPGLGARIEEKWFRHQFKGKTGPMTMVPEGSPAENNQFDAITGATITSTAIKTMVNEAFKKAPELVNEQPQKEEK